MTDPFGHQRQAETETVDLGVVDKDGIPVPEFWQANVAKWEKQPIGWRRQRSASAQVKAVQKKIVQREPASRFTTDYAVRHGRKLGWTLIEREQYDYRTKRHRDLEGQVDAIFDDGEGRVGVQAAGRGERAAHYQRFMDWGGAEKALRRHLRVLYWVFERGNTVPVEMEEWA